MAFPRDYEKVYYSSTINVPGSRLNRRDMNQEDNPRFAHITVGQIPRDSSSSTEDEEVIAIGAVDLEVKSQSGSSFDHINEEATVSSTQEEPFKTDGGDSESQKETGKTQSRQVAFEEEFGEPMPLIQKLVIVGCGIGLVVAVVLLLWYWAT